MSVPNPFAAVRRITECNTNAQCPSRQHCAVILGDCAKWCEGAQARKFAQGVPSKQSDETPR